MGRHGDGWRVRLTAPPEKGRANEALVALLAETLRVPKSAVRVVAGRTSRRKVVEVDDLEVAEIESRLG